jgi:hypothetical protein
MVGITLPLVTGTSLDTAGFGKRQGWRGPGKVDLPTPQARLF